MIVYARYDSHGRYTFFGTAGEGFNPQGAANVYVGLVNINDQYHDIARNVPVDKPPKPGDGYDFNYATKQWEKNVEKAMALNRIKRDRLIAGTDWRVIKAAETGVEMSSEWSAYRQALRDITGQPDQFNIQWPEPPSN